MSCIITLAVYTQSKNKMSSHHLHARRAKMPKTLHTSANRPPQLVDERTRVVFDGSEACAEFEKQKREMEKQYGAQEGF